MSQFYSDPSREQETYALPNCEVFYAEAGELEWEGQEEPSEAGYYYWFCFPGCMPEGDPIGPFKTAAEAVEDCRDNCTD